MRRSVSQDFMPSQLSLWLLQERCSSSVLSNLGKDPLGSYSSSDSPSPLGPRGCNELSELGGSQNPEFYHES
jgi:hypothetical protein